jgi:hypothetical protein
MTESQWIILVASFFTGGAAGAIITAAVTKYKNRRQPVGYIKETIEIFKKNLELPSLQAILMIGESGGGPGIAFENLSVARITVINKGNEDIEEFKFGITLTGENKAVDLKWETPDRHHVLTLLTPVGLSTTPRKELDFTLKPFNRGEPYIVNVYYTYTDVPGSIKLSSSHSTQFIEMGITSEFAKEALELIPIIGPFVKPLKKWVSMK